MKTFNLVNIIVSLVTLTVLWCDYLFVHELNIEGIFILTTSTAIVLNITRQVYPTIWCNRTLGIASNLAIGLSCCLGFYVLAMMLFGYGFTGRKVQLIWFLITTSALLTIALALLDTMKIWKLNK